MYQSILLNIASLSWEISYTIGLFNSNLFIGSHFSTCYGRLFWHDSNISKRPPEKKRKKYICMFAILNESEWQLSLFEV